MQWTPGGTSSDIEDRRGESGGGGGFGGFGFGGGGGGFGRGVPLSLGGLLFVLLMTFLYNGGMPGGGGESPEPAPARERSSGSADRSGEDMQVKFVSFVLDDAQATWDRKLQGYRHAKLVLFRDYTQSGCGNAQSATGPFYCPADEKVYLDLNFFAELSQRFGAPGEFAQAYVIAHEIGHHIQKVIGLEQQVRRLQRANPSERNPLSVKLELQADCLAGVWGNSTRERSIIDQADMAAGLRAAAAIGDDRLQRLGKGHVSPESFTHGSSEQRMAWLKRGLDTGDVQACNTFEESTR
jgi:predicted metalloprotease